ncbi:MAG: sigma-70 family RNA polymerase sigma factor [Acetobacter sp.]
MQLSHCVTHALATCLPINHTGGQRVRLFNNSDQCSIWLATHILPHENHIRARLRRYADIDADDIIHEAYVTIAEADWAGIGNPRAYFMSICRNLVMQHYRSARVVPVTSLALMQAETMPDTMPSDERVVHARQEMRFLEKAIAKLPARCRDIFILRRARGLSQRECAAHLNISENVVEKQLARALVFLSKEYSESEREMTVDEERRPRLAHSRKRHP